MDYDLHHNIKALSAIDIQAITSNTTVVGNIIDTKDFGSIEFVAFGKAVTDGDFDIVIHHGDDSALSDAAALPAANRLGSLFAYDEYDDNGLKRVGAISKKRYIRASIVSTNTSSGVDAFGVIAILGNPKRAPVAEQV